MHEIIKREDALFGHISKLIDEAHKHVKTTVNTTMVYTYYGVGKYIVEDEQQGYERAAYGKKVLKVLSDRLCLKCLFPTRLCCKLRLKSGLRSLKKMRS